MTVNELCELVKGTLQAGELKNAEVSGAYTSDLLSDVMAHAADGQALVTIQAHKNTIAVASLYGAPCIVICNDRPIPADMAEAASAEGIALMVTGLNQFEVSGLVWARMRGLA